MVHKIAKCGSLWRGDDDDDCVWRTDSRRTCLLVPLRICSWYVECCCTCSMMNGCRLNKKHGPKKREFGSNVSVAGESGATQICQHRSGSSQVVLSLNLRHVQLLRSPIHLFSHDIYWYDFCKPKQGSTGVVKRRGKSDPHLRREPGFAARALRPHCRYRTGFVLISFLPSPGKSGSVCANSLIFGQSGRIYLI